MQRLFEFFVEPWMIEELQDVEMVAMHLCALNSLSSRAGICMCENVGLSAEMFGGGWCCHNVMFSF